MIPVSSNRVVGDLTLLDNPDPEAWEQAYVTVMDAKYRKQTRKYTINITDIPKYWAKYFPDIQATGGAPIYVIPRVRGGPSFKSTPLHDPATEGGLLPSESVFYAGISKGYSWQDVSSFSIGPLPKHDLCLVNAAFSKSITLAHIQGGEVDYHRKDFWKPLPVKRRRNIELGQDGYLLVDGESHRTETWLREHQDLWLPEWSKWRRSVAMCSKGDFHWTDKSSVIIYYDHVADRFMDFVEWKLNCYVRPSLDLLPQVPAFQDLLKLHREGIPLGLVHPKGTKVGPEEPVTREQLLELFHDPMEMCCQPYVVAAGLLGMTV